MLGHYISNLKMGPLKLNSGQFDMVLARLDAKGSFQWAVSTKGSGLVVPYRIQIDSQKNLYLTGEIEGEKIFGTFSFKAPSHGDFFVAQLTPKGVYSWVKHNTGGTSHVHPQV